MSLTKCFIGGLLFGVVFYLGVVYLHGQTKPEVPVIPLEQQNAYYRADADLARAQNVLDKAMFQRAAAVADMNRTCGEKFVPSPTPDGKNLVCVAKPEDKK